MGISKIRQNWVIYAQEQRVKQGLPPYTDEEVQKAFLETQAVKKKPGPKPKP